MNKASRNRSRRRDAFDSLRRVGPGQDEKLQHLELGSALRALTAEAGVLRIRRENLTHQRHGDRQVGRDRSPTARWVLIQSIRSARYRSRQGLRRYWERLGAQRDERGYAAVELLAMATVLVGFIVTVVGAGRFVDAMSQVDDAAYAAARAASLESNVEAGQIAGRKAAEDSLADRGKACTRLTVSFAGTDFRTSGHVNVQVTCRADLSDVVGFGLPGAKDFTATAVVPIEQYRRLP